MSSLNFTSIEQTFNEHASRSRVLEIQLQPAGVLEISIVDTDLPVYRNILVSEAVTLFKLAKPVSVFIRNADPVNAANWWNELKSVFTTEVNEIYFSLIGMGNNWKPDLQEAAVVLKESVEKMAVMKPNVFTTHATETLVSFVSSQQESGTPNGRTRPVINAFTVEVLGNYNLRTSYGSLFQNILMDQLTNLRKFYLICEFPCFKCTQRIFDSMGWPFPDTSTPGRDNIPFWGSADEPDMPYHLKDHAKKFAKFKEFTIIGSPSTLVRTFYGPMVDEPVPFEADQPNHNHDSGTVYTRGIAGTHDPNYQTLAGAAC